MVESLQFVEIVNWVGIPRRSFAAEGGFRVVAVYSSPHRRGGVLLRPQNFAAGAAVLAVTKCPFRVNRKGRQAVERCIVVASSARPCPFAS